MDLKVTLQAEASNYAYVRKVGGFYVLQVLDPQPKPQEVFKNFNLIKPLQRLPMFIKRVTMTPLLFQLEICTITFKKSGVEDVLSKYKVLVKKRKGPSAVIVESENQKDPIDPAVLLQSEASVSIAEPDLTTLPVHGFYC